MSKAKKNSIYTGTKKNDLMGQSKNSNSESDSKKNYKHKYAPETIYFYDKTLHGKLKQICIHQGLSLNQAVNIWAALYVSKNEHLIK